MGRRFAIASLIVASTACACESFVVLGGVEDASSGDDSVDAQSDGSPANDGPSFDAQHDSNNLDAGPGGCFTNGDCVPDTDYCQTSAGACGSLGSCQTRPTFCVDASIEDASGDGDTHFCDCAGDTVINPCVASQLGESIKHAGSCP